MSDTQPPPYIPSQPSGPGAQNPYHAGYDQGGQDKPTQAHWQAPPQAQPGVSAPPQPGVYAPPQPGVYASPQPGVYAPHPVHSTTNNTVVVAQTGITPVICTQARPIDYTVSSILTCFFCCPILGLIALICACQSRSAADSGNMEEAYARSRNARQLIIASIAVGIAVYILYVILFAAVRVQENTYYGY